MLRSRSRYQDLGEKPSKYFFNLQNRNFVIKTTNKIIESDGTEYSETKEILKCQQKFYENLYSDISNDVDGNPIEDIVGENENNLSNDESQKLEGDIKLGELSNSLKNMKNDKSPGLDGFTVDFFLISFWTDLKYFILKYKIYVKNFVCALMFRRYYVSNNLFCKMITKGVSEKDIRQISNLKDSFFSNKISS